MKRQIAAMMIALPLGSISLLPKSASALEIHPQLIIDHSPVVVAQRPEQYQHRNDRRVWVPAHWEREPNGHRRWIPGHWVYRR